MKKLIFIVILCLLSYSSEAQIIKTKYSVVSDNWDRFDVSVYNPETNFHFREGYDVKVTLISGKDTIVLKKSSPVIARFLYEYKKLQDSVDLIVSCAGYKTVRGRVSTYNKEAKQIAVYRVVLPKEEKSVPANE